MALIAQTAWANHYFAPPDRMRGLDPAAQYRLCLLLLDCSDFETTPQPEIGRETSLLSGPALMQSGIALPMLGPQTACPILLERVDSSQD
jgi:alpha-galactosidase